MVTQNGVPFTSRKNSPTAHKFRTLWKDGYCYVAAIPTYVGGHLAMGWATDNKKLRQHTVKTIANRYAKAGKFKTTYWSPEVHCGLRPAALHRRARGQGEAEQETQEVAVSARTASTPLAVTS